MSVLRWFPYWCLLSCLLLGLTACNPAAEMSDAKEKANALRQQWNAEEFSAIYTQAGSDFRGATSEEEYQRLFKTLRTKFGKVTSSKMAGIKMQKINLRSLVVVSFETTYEHGKATEVFTLERKNGEFILLGWNINSPDIVRFLSESVESSSPATDEPSAP